MATLIDADGEVIAETNNLTLDDMVEETPETTEVAPESPEVESPAEEPEAEVLPDKYQGKSATDIARMHQELEKRLGQQSSEVGELRQAFDDMVRQGMAQQAPTPEVKEVEEVDFFADPMAAVNQQIANNPVMRQMQEATMQLQK
jgi:HAMP domain-containing protein